MKSKLAVDVTNGTSSQEVVHNPPPEEFQRDGKPVFWCGSCESYMPKHMCEWKVLSAVVLGAAIVCVIGIWGLLSGLW